MERRADRQVDIADEAVTLAQDNARKAGVRNFLVDTGQLVVPWRLLIISTLPLHLKLLLSATQWPVHGVIYPA